MQEAPEFQHQFNNFLHDQSTKSIDKKETEELVDNISDPALQKLFGLREIATFVEQEFQRASDGRQVTENIWRRNWDQFRGIYSNTEQSALSELKTRNPNAEDVFVKITKTKTLAAHGQLLEVLEADKRFPIVIEATPVPEGMPDFVYVDSRPQAESDMSMDVYGFAGDGNDPDQGSTYWSLLKGQAERLKGILGDKTLKAGPSPDKMSAPQLNPAEMSAQKMDKLVQDQLIETHAKQALRRASIECCIFGSGIVKGPFSWDKVIHDWERADGGEITYKPRFKKSPRIEHVSVWDFFPDPDARTLDECEFVVQRHYLSRSQVRALDAQPGFDKAALERILAKRPVSQPATNDGLLQDNANNVVKERYTVLEYWGFLSRPMAENIGLKIGAQWLDSIQVNAWVSGGEVLRIVLNPFIPARIPYLVFPYEEHPFQLWGVGVPENMEDSQRLMNGHTRMWIDNLRYAGNVVYEIDDSKLLPGQDLNMFPGKVIYTDGGLGQAINTIKFQSTAQEHMQAYDKARQLADEVTGIASYSHGQTGVSGMTRTASGMSMLMGASALNVKTIIKNIDHFLLQPLGEALFAWNMQFNEDLPEIRGDLTIKATGTATLMQREVTTQRILSLIQVASNPLFAPFFNAENAFKEIAKNLDLDPDVFINDQTMAQLYAQQIMGNINAYPQGTVPQANGTAGQGSGGQPQPATGGINPADQSGSGGGNIGVGAPPQAGPSAAA